MPPINTSGVILERMAKMTGYIHSKESFGALDGPGIRYVLFMQGCPMRCLYCHNPDTWQIGAGEPVTVDEVMEELHKNRHFYSGGGITVSGGEPLLQIDFITELFRAAKERGIHTCIDTSGITYSDTNEEYIKKLDLLMQNTDLVMLDIKHIDPKAHTALTGHSNEGPLGFAKYLDSRNVTIWIRHVVVEGHTDDKDQLYSLGRFIGRLKNLQALDVLPYHRMGEVKYEALNIPYPLGNLPATTKEKAEWARGVILDGIRSVRARH